MPLKLIKALHSELCTWFDNLEFCFLFFRLYKNYTLLFALSCLPVCKPQAVGRGIAIRAKVEQKGRVIFTISSELVNLSLHLELELWLTYEL